MDTFVLPGWMPSTELVDRAGKALFKDRWRGALPTTLELEGVLGPLNARMGRRLEARRAEEPEKAEMHDRIVEKIREAACTGVITSGIKAAYGHIHEGRPPPHFWGGNRALTAFNTEWTIDGREVRAPWVHDGPLVAPDAVSGRVLFKRDEAEAWLATLEARPAEGDAVTAVADAPAARHSPSIAEVLGAEEPAAAPPEPDGLAPGDCGNLTDVRQKVGLSMTSSPTSTKKRVRDRDLDRWIQARMQECEVAGRRYYSREQDIADARKQFGDRTTIEQLRAARNRNLPYEIRKGGAPRKRAPSND